MNLSVLLKNKNCITFLIYIIDIIGIYLFFDQMKLEDIVFFESSNLIQF